VLYVQLLLSLCLINYVPRHDTWENGGVALMSALDLGEWSPSWPGVFTPRERTPCYLN
jgi:hypothetical protein